MLLVCKHKRHIAIDARSGVPPRARLKTVVDAHGKDITASATIHIRCYIVLERIVAIGIFAHHATVYPHLTFHIHSVEAHKHTLVVERIGKDERLAVPPGATGHEPALRTARIAPVVGAFYTPVVGHIDSTPGTVVEIRGSIADIIFQPEPPVGIKWQHSLCRQTIARRYKNKYQNNRAKYTSCHIFLTISNPDFNINFKVSCDVARSYSFSDSGNSS